MAKNATDRGGTASGKVSRRAFLSTSTAGIALVGVNAREADSQSVSQPNWDRSADVVVIGATGDLAKRKLMPALAINVTS